MVLVQSGTKSPDFSLPDHDGKTHQLSSYRGHFVLVYFYPKDFTPGCTKEACAIRDEYKNFEKNDIKVFGISSDSGGSHKKFIEKYHLPFPLLSDPEKKVIKSFGAVGAVGKTMRVSILINPEGDIIKTYPHVDPAAHAKEILADIKSMQKQPSPSDKDTY
jgi:peroxiredoxin Q/BCP